MAPPAPKSSRTLKADLRKAGLSDSAVQAAWPSWWTNDAESSLSAQTELRFALARKLGLSAPALIGDRIDFVWRDEAKFKHLADVDEQHASAIASFAVAVGQLLIQATPAFSSRPVALSASSIRHSLLKTRSFVDLQGLLVICWSIGVPVVHLRVFPLSRKAMHATAVSAKGRHAILLGRDATYPAPVAFDLAHELGHIVLGHLSNMRAIIDADGRQYDGEQVDLEERQADEFALALLTGQEVPDIRFNVTSYSARQLARAAVSAGRARHIEPGTLALCAAYGTGAWATASAALRMIYDAPKPVWSEVNNIAVGELDWNQLGDDSTEYLQNLMGYPVERRSTAR